MHTFFNALKSWSLLKFQLLGVSLFQSGQLFNQASTPFRSYKGTLLFT